MARVASLRLGVVPVEVWISEGVWVGVCPRHTAHVYRSGPASLLLLNCHKKHISNVNIMLKTEVDSKDGI